MRSGLGNRMSAQFVQLVTTPKFAERVSSKQLLFRPVIETIARVSVLHVLVGVHVSATHPNVAG